ncbi:MAG TPA: thioredoxin domain-containing protein [Leptolyngbyaceae cyanobacterium M33_DOE_097]|uniref:Thioredoxin domain-containing protein n=1 Tax=Oscillatoriales cyanobacterium SpSt-418 TaxID=2282169 RepID=A0A7C3PHU9_9CYAN|nr:thioredoxin domain-containing protein [Leptolyngbyaceae cyanobacterium M33_DOE_097]
MPNRLANAESLYLRKHADNPIDWWAWNAEALATAREQDKPIFLSIGYSSCHWCTVMEGEAFSDLAIAAYMNENFLPIKVDREERPDLDSIYMQALQMMTGQGGWPLNIFLAPDDLVPFYGGTYFPIEPRYGRPGFLQVLQAIRNYYDTQKQKLQDVKDEIFMHLRESATLKTSQNLNFSLLQKGLDYSTGIISGRTPGPSFPMIPYAEAAQRAARFNFESRYNANEASLQRGLDLALGGIFDHVGGGFHRYTVDPTWTVPHFEKMLYDNGQITEYLSNLWASGAQEPAFKRAIALTVQWLKREMTAPEGYFYAAQDADSFTTPEEKEPEEGAFYVWDYPTLTNLLSAQELEELTQYFTVNEKGNFEGHNVLQRRQAGEIPESLEIALAKLFVTRYGSSSTELTTFTPARNNAEVKAIAWPARIPPVTDTKMIVAWNSLMISGLSRAGVVFQQPNYLDLAIQATTFILKHQWQSERFHRVNYEGKPSVLAQSEDYALFVKALLDLHQACLSLGQTNSAETWLQAAVQVQTEFDNYLWSIELGGYFNTDASSDLLIRERSYTDNATPSANGVAVSNLVRLALLTENLDYLDRAEQTLQAFSSVMEKAPQACPSLFSGLDWFYHHTLIRTTDAWLEQLGQQYVPTAALKATDDLPDSAIALVCEGLSCKEPALTPDQLSQQVLASQTRG